MANEKRLIDANDVIDEINEAISNIAFTSPYQSDISTMVSGMERVLDIVEASPTVDAVEAKKYEELVGMYHELRENFVDYVCSGIPNVAPYCLNKCEGCVTVHGWCKFASDKCKGFNPAEVILYRFAKMDGDGNA